MSSVFHDDLLTLKQVAAKLFNKSLGITPSRTTVYRRATTRCAIQNFLREINQGAMEFDPGFLT